MKQELLTIGLLGPLATLTACAATPAQSTKPNVLIILTDDQGYGDFSCHGHPVVKTPSIDRLRNQSVRFTDFHVAPICTPTRGQLMTGRDSLANGAYCVCSGHEFVRTDMPTMAELFKANGYGTGIFGKWHLGDNYPYRPQDRGFQEVLSFKGYGLESVASYWNDECMNPWLVDSHDRWRQEQGYCTDIYFNNAMKWMKSCADKKKPFMIYLPTNAAHWPYQVAAQYKQPYAKMGPRLAAFYGMIANIDENVARCDNFLKENGLFDNTIVILMTDNGSSEECTARVYNAGMRGQKASYYEGGHRVPCFIRWPAGGLCGPVDIDTAAQVQDILPTLIDLCGVTPSQKVTFDGASLAPLLRNREEPTLKERMFVVQCALWDEYLHPNKWAGTVVWDKWRLVKGTELFDLRSDPGQHQDISAQHPDIVAKMRHHYETWWANVEPLVLEWQPIHLGSAREPVAVLTSHNWIAPNTADQSRISHGDRQNGPWHVMVEQPGKYEITLRRWPVEANLPLTAPAAPYISKVVVTEEDKHQPFNHTPVGVSLPIAKARLKIGEFDETKPATPGDKSVAFQLTLPAGRTTLQTWFSDATGKPLCGAYYVYCRILTPANTNHAVHDPTLIPSDSGSGQ